MRKDLAEVVLVVDRSGSMASCQADAQGGVNQFIETQKEAEGEANFTLVQFDTEYDFVWAGEPVENVTPYKLEPRGWTALLDAVGRAIAETGARLESRPESERPGLVAFVVVTDGGENSSKEYTLDQVREMIQHQQDKYNWQFTFIGAGPEAFSGGVKMGMANSVRASTAKQEEVYTSGGELVARMRGQARRGEEVFNMFSSDELASMDDD